MVAAIRDGTKPSPADVHDYVALSVLHHCYDGWSYLSRAIGAETTANPEIARHLGYYAQLRAAMSILAVNGVGIMGRKYVIVDKKGDYSVHPCNTHDFAWGALMTLTDSTNYAVFLDTIRPDGRPLGKWTEAVGVRGNQLAASWVRKWSQEFHNMPDDRYSRNQASYEPVGLSPITVGARPVKEVLDAVVAMWRLLEPQDNVGFAKLDWYLLRQAVRRISALHDSIQPGCGTDKTVATITEGMDEAQRQRWKHVFSAEDEDGDEVVATTDADGSGSQHNGDSMLLLRRALLLLRVATGGVSDLLSECDDVRTRLEFWWGHPSVRRGLWVDKDAPESFSDLWADIDVAMEQVGNWGYGSRICYYDLWQECASEVATLSTLDRVFLWGSGL